DLISQVQPGVSTNYFICDGHGSTRMLVGAGGNIVNVFAYDAFGSLIASNGASQTAYLYCGQQWDSDLGFYLNRARYLNPDTGRFWTMDSYDGDDEDPLSLHKYLYGADNPVNMRDPSGHDYGAFDINLASILTPLVLPTVPTELSDALLSEPGLGVYTPIALAPAITVYISVDTAGIPPSFNASAIQSTLQTQLSANVFNLPPPGHSVTVKVHDESSGPGTLGWIGSPKHAYVNRVNWTLNAGIASSGGGETRLNRAQIEGQCSGSPTTQTYVNIFAHEVFWLNAGGHWDHDWNPNGEITAGTAFPFSPYTVLPSSRTTLRSDFGF
ncbi:MAG TPA: RHS repeat-associated core domain-containing protein, partial [Verrucomicrobiae bacterium]|nr:RHS repeat-associated core domain-containing protein [Verrucomicrobiae bacterium]